MADKHDLFREITGFSPNTNVDVRILRGQKEQSIAVNLGKFPKNLLPRIENAEHSPLDPKWIEMKLGLNLRFVVREEGAVASSGERLAQQATSSGIGTRQQLSRRLPEPSK